MLLIFLLINLIYGNNYITWIAKINNTFIISYFNPNDPTLNRYCGKGINKIIQDIYGFYYVVEDFGKNNCYMTPYNYKDLSNNYVLGLNKNQNCFINKTFNLDFEQDYKQIQCSLFN